MTRRQEIIDNWQPPRRFRIYSISHKDFAHLICPLTNGTHWFRAHCPDLPEDAVLFEVDSSWDRRSFRLKFAHPSFDVVPEYAYCPDMGRLNVQMREDSDAADQPAVIPTGGQAG